MDKQWLLLDRDGVINHDSDAYIKSPEEWVPVPGSIEAIAQLTRQGYKVAVITNQSGLARGYFSLATLSAMHNKMCRLVEECGGQIEAIYFCPHGPDDNCSCRKPRTGLIDQLEQDKQINVAGCYLVGDSLKDLQLALAKNCQPILVRSGKGEKTEQALPNAIAQDPRLQAVKIFDRLSDFAYYLIND
ncbi:D-glycero-beta-D-manno-heptose 1,7-bisphosphate 7-phosphatase [Teredinibacter sp. KSP-S5-2]|uniref:D-glycero-beta-D-manno-heptose 1,7-bisphosphate 7-phosphatase n=1 Tax=Teredinibacter sp. KSP-S5-2 TaxID=3034506 RepID=UPI002934F231|nr:D-glycero-beta-D-manno-heptose 1,7-bisphosphate 7-phosphatase [Teredinibacter sp. KSP-S5-2]WNO09154.1 D-glycero-beta-D-manno-heptose 1,7-bisphosphate 7-phosphatase [Teredinibacter sp. KSP-S5-2]